MILYCDTSALVKLFVHEANAARVRDAAAASSLLMTHVIAYAEACAAFARLAARKAEKRMFVRLKHALDEHWPDWHIIAADEPLVRRAGDLAAVHALRGFDSVHLAAAEAAYGASRGQLAFRFAVFDIDLARAATALGIPLLGS